MFWIALLLGVIEGLTEFLPISSTGHLILVSDFLEFTPARSEAFVIFPQLGAILAVVWEHRARLARVARDFRQEAGARAFVWRLAVAFVPAALLGLAGHDQLRQLFNSAMVAAALIVGAGLIWIVEALPLKVRTHDTDAVSLRQALVIGLAQCLALWPGISRSAATILGGLTAGLDRRTATEFSFFLAIPTLSAATLWSLWENRSLLEPGDALWLALSFVVSFLVAWVSIRWLLRFVSTHRFGVFAWYRLILGLILLFVLSR